MGLNNKNTMKTNDFFITTQIIIFETKPIFT